MTAGSVALGFCTRGWPRVEFMQSVQYVLDVEARGQDRVGPRLCQRGTILPQLRNDLVRDFLARGADWLWLLDDDVSFPGQTLDVLLDAATSDCVVGAHYLRDDRRPSWTDERGEPVGPAAGSPLGSVLPVGAVGMGCTLVARAVLETMRDADDPWPWFGHDDGRVGDPPIGAVMLGEDVSFCRRAARAGFSVYGLNWPVSHHKTVELIP